jgi:hypothetical protein
VLDDRNQKNQRNRASYAPIKLPAHQKPLAAPDFTAPQLSHRKTNHENSTHCKKGQRLDRTCRIKRRCRDSRPTIAMNAHDSVWQIDRTIMASCPSIRIARKARSKAESDFATWLMMAKLSSFDDLPTNAQGFLTNYRARLERMSEAESKVLAVREVYAAY